MLKLLITGLLVILVAGCGETGKPNPGYGDPCDTAAAGLLGCPAVSGPSQAVTAVADACRKLVVCGVLAESYMQSSGTACENSSTCTGAGGECLVTPKGESTCHYPTLDYWWCVRRLQLTSTVTNPCDDKGRFTAEHVQQAIACIEATPCASLGLSFATKRLSPCTSETTPGTPCRTAMDEITCADQTHTAWTATTCDYGMLSY
jgi:hypothetical protein